MAPRTSFLLPARNAAETVVGAVESALAQTDPDLEVVVVDDGSSDGTADRLASVHDPRLRVLRQPPLGLVAALQHGLAQARGAFVARMDADDVAAPHRLERQLPRLARGDVWLVDGQVRFVRDEGEVPGGMRRYETWINGVVQPTDFDRELLIDSPVVHPAATMRREVLESLGGYRDGDFPEDYDLWLRAHAAGHRFAKVPEVLVTMRDRPQRLTRTDSRYRRDAFRELKRAWVQRILPARIVLLGAGREGRWWQRALDPHVVAIVDVARSGQRHGVPILPPEALGEVEADVALAAVGARGARPAVRALLAQHGWTEGVDAWCLA